MMSAQRGPLFVTEGSKPRFW